MNARRKITLKPGQIYDKIHGVIPITYSLTKGWLAYSPQLVSVNSPDGQSVNSRLV
ncbi:MAG: hypothetical protein NZ901_13120 [Geminocystis sp.]|nr:hypothetical protein [Geminocystis sp.]HIK38481.1 hypothetical protein [Geminocystis sp. M7585_C2015_104]MCS7149107.1 hypothetical protein [Geminocystis sp.]MCX8078458.1 hypothetical protein [Geminocystis sp.]MDW8115959.1 hypothetical protein [Geminocystis sp.]